MVSLVFACVQPFLRYGERTFRKHVWGILAATKSGRWYSSPWLCTNNRLTLISSLSARSLLIYGETQLSKSVLLYQRLEEMKLTEIFQIIRASTTTSATDHLRASFHHRLTAPEEAFLIVSAYDERLFCSSYDYRVTLLLKVNCA